MMTGLGSASLVVSSALAAGAAVAAGDAFELRVLRARKIYSDGGHNAFTGMVQLEGRYVICFRSAENHMTPTGGIRVIASPDGTEWGPVYFVRLPDTDLRDPKLVVFRNQLLCYFVAVTHDGNDRKRVMMRTRSADGRVFEEPVTLEGLTGGAWLWHVAAHGDTLYGTGYGGAGETNPELYRSADGLRWEKLADFPTTGNEVFLDTESDDVIWALVRNHTPRAEMVLCRIEPPYTKVETHRRIPMPVGGPMVKRLPTGCVIITRHWDPPGRRNLRSEVLWLPDGGDVRSITRLPSGGDTSYASWLDIAPGRALVSYYSSHEHKMDDPIGFEHPDDAHAEHSTAADIFLAEVSYTPHAPSESVTEKRGSQACESPLVLAGPRVAVDNVCAWPNLTVMPDGAIVATIFNQPSHAGWPGDVECWATTDDGATWEKRGTPAPHDPTTNRMNVAAGLAQNGDLIVIASGWSARYMPGEKPRPGDERRVLEPWLCRSSDGARTWTIDKQAFPAKAPNGNSPIPFGDILPGSDGALRVAVYTSGSQRVYIYRSPDDGKTWEEPVPLHDDAPRTETALCHLGKGRWLAAARTHIRCEKGARTPHGLDMHLELYASSDDAKTWTPRGPIAAHPMHHPAHFLRLRDGSLIFSYGNRAGDGTKGREGNGVEILVSRDAGQTWSEPIRLVDWQGDGGYPSSAERSDGRILTAYYAQRVGDHTRYHMGVVTWDSVNVGMETE